MKSVKIAAVILALSFLYQTMSATTTMAINPADFNPGRIIDDEVFYNKDGFGSVGEIQDFLNAHVPACDTWGTQPSGYGNLNRAQYLQQIKGWPGPPYVCLNNYHENPDTNVTSFEKGGGWFEGGLSAAQIIYSAAQQYRINPKVLLVTLRKESLNLFGDSFPMKSQYKYSMGYACPDSGPNYSANCNNDKAGFYKQMMTAAWQLRYYNDYMGTYNFAPGRWNTIQYAPNPGCGTKDVYIQNYATASLYIYTPYVPNDAALNAYPGEAPCGAYGNRNFWFIWQEWFGSTYGKVESSGVNVQADGVGQRFTNADTRISFTIKNITRQVFSYEKVGVAIRGSNGENLDPGWDSNVTLQPGQEYTYTRTVRVSAEGKYVVSSGSLENGIWKGCTFDKSEALCSEQKLFQAPVLVTKNPFIVDQKTGLETTDIRQMRSYKAGYSVKNTSNTYSVRLGRLMLGGRTQNGENRDLAQMTIGTLKPDAQVDYSASMKLNDPVGTRYKFFTSSTRNDGESYDDISWVSASPNISESSISRPGVSLTQGISVTDLVKNGRSHVTMRIKNFQDTPVDLGRIGVSIRGPQGQNADPDWQRIEQLRPDEEYLYNAPFSSSVEGDWKITYGHTDANYSNWDTVYPTDERAGAVRSVTKNASDSVRITQGPAVTGVVHVNEKTTVTMKVKNSSATPVDVGRIGVSIRGPQGQNMDPLWQRVDSLSNEELVYSATFTPDSTGDWRIAYGHSTSDFSRWDSEYPLSNSDLVRRSMIINVKDSVVMTQGPILPASVHVGEPTEITMKFKNFSSQPVDIGRIGVSVRGPQGQNADPLWQRVDSLQPGEMTYIATIVPEVPGTWRIAFGHASVDYTRWDDIYPMNDTDAVKRSITVDVKPQVTIVGGITTEKIANNEHMITMKLKNFGKTEKKIGLFGIGARDPKGANYDPLWVDPIIKAGETYEYKTTLVLDKNGTWNLGVGNLSSEGWTDRLPVSEVDTIKRTATITY